MAERESMNSSSLPETKVSGEGKAPTTVRDVINPALFWCHVKWSCVYTYTCTVDWMLLQKFLLKQMNDGSPYIVV